jgi:hypothetical protein
LSVRTEGYYADVEKCEDETINEVELEATVRSL